MMFETAIDHIYVRLFGGYKGQSSWYLTASVTRMLVYMQDNETRSAELTGAMARSTAGVCFG